jgi:nitric oxide reductase activation protein
MKPQAKRILAVLSDGNPHSAAEFWSGVHGPYIAAVSQRVGELRRAGHDIRNISKDGGVATYQLQP